MRTRFLVSVTVTDLAGLVLAYLFSSLFVFGTPFPWQSEEGTAVLPMLAFLAGSMALVSLITSQMLGHGVPRPTYGRMFLIALGSAASTAVLVVFFRTYYSRSFLLMAGLIWLLFASTHRVVRRLRPWTERIGVISSETELVEHLASSPHASVIWVVDPKNDGPLDLPERGVTIAVDLRAVLSERVAQFVSSCDVAGYTIRPFTSIYEEHTGRVPLVHLAEGWEISAPLLEVAPWLFGKRIFDLIATVVTGPIWLLLGLLVGLYVKAASPGPAIFRQLRVGYEGRTFTMYKFRTMSLDAEEEGPRFAEENDARLIPGGWFLRKSRLDEIPQMWNVIRGEMSLVGPRAEQVSFVEHFRREIPFYDHRHLVRPGITGWAQVNYGYADDQADTVEKLTYDLYYVKHMSPVMDLRVLSKSVLIVLSGEGAR